MAGHRIFVFKTTYLTFKVERELKKAGIPYKIVTKPRGISSDCGLAVQVAEQDEAAVSSLLTTSGIECAGVW